MLIVKAGHHVLQISSCELQQFVRQYAIGQSVRISPVRKEGVHDDLGCVGLQWDRATEPHQAIRDNKDLVVARSWTS